MVAGNPELRNPRRAKVTHPGWFDAPNRAMCAPEIVFRRCHLGTHVFGLRRTLTPYSCGPRVADSVPVALGVPPTASARAAHGCLLPPDASSRYALRARGRSRPPIPSQYAETVAVRRCRRSTSMPSQYADAVAVRRYRRSTPMPSQYVDTVAGTVAEVVAGTVAEVVAGTVAEVVAGTVAALAIRVWLRPCRVRVGVLGD